MQCIVKLVSSTTQNVTAIICPKYNGIADLFEQYLVLHWRWIKPNLSERHLFTPLWVLHSILCALAKQQWAIECINLSRDWWQQWSP